MTRKMRKFSAGGAQGKYDRRMADIEKDFKKDSAGKTGRAAEVLAAKRDQRKADAEDDRAKRMGLDRTKTREAERNAEYNLTRTRRSGAAMPAVTKDELIAPGKLTESLGPITVPKSGLATAAKKAPVKVADKPKPSAADTKRNKFFQDSLRTSNFKAVGDAANARQKAKIGASNVPSDQGFSRKSKVLGASTKTSTLTPTTTGGTALRGKPGGTPLIRFGKDVTNDPARAVKLATLKKAAEAPGASGYDKDRYKRAVSSGMVGAAKGGAVKKEKTMKYAKGGSTTSKPPQPSAADRARSKAQLDSLKKAKPTAAEGKVAGSANRSEGPGYKKGGKAKGKPFAATKFGAALMKKSADTKGRAMVKMAAGGSASKRADGCAIKGKTKGKMLARGGAAKMRGRDSYGGAEFKNGGSC
jgi:hypothetical protein